MKVIQTEKVSKQSLGCHDMMKILHYLKPENDSDKDRGYLRTKVGEVTGEQRKLHIEGLRNW
jgi:hypothetical protein